MQSISKQISNLKLQISNNTLLTLIILVAIGGFFRLYKLSWGAPFFFHPDERNIASSISQLHFPDQLHPHFFAYGSLPLYFTYFSLLIKNALTTCNFSLSCPVSFEDAIITTRIISAFLSVLLIPIMYSLGNSMRKGSGLFVATITAFSTGFIQFAHFGTVEMWITFFTVLLFITLRQSIQKPTLILSILIGLLMGILISTKISNVSLFLLPVITYGIILWNTPRYLLKAISHVIIILILTGIIFLFTNPYVLIDTQAFLSSMRYESSVGLGTLPVFYTGEFFTATPFLFQFSKIYPFLINPLLTVFLIISLFWIFRKGAIKQQKDRMLLTFFLLVMFLSQITLFVQWTRYFIPTLPFIYLLISQWIFEQKKYKGVLIILSIISSFLFSTSYFITAFIETDTRIAAMQFAKKSLPTSASILSETYDLGILPFNQTYPHITLFNTYELDTTAISLGDLKKALEENDYLILPSQRVIETRLQNPKIFPVGYRFYQALLSNQLGFQQIYQTPCSLFCTITYLGNPVSSFEQTSSVFERPTLYIFKKI